MNLFERLSAGRPPAEKLPAEPLPIHWAARILLEWLQQGWDQPTIRARDICHFGPNSIRDRESALNAAKVLEKRGWLLPLKAPQRNVKQWQITIGPLDLSEDSHRARYNVT